MSFAVEEVSLISAAIGPCVDTVAGTLILYPFAGIAVTARPCVGSLSGALFFNESLRLTQFIGIVLMMGCLVLSVKKEEGEQRKKSLRWFFLSVVACALCGGVGIMQKGW